MKRSKRHRVKLEQPETSTSRFPSQKEHDLAYYIHDRVELMHQVFSVLKSKELKAMAPECVRHISVSDLQELCMEELLGISSKRLCAILDGATPPSDTESSSESEQLETISLDSISSDEEILSQVSAKKSKKHKHRSKSKPKKRSKSKTREPEQEQADRSRRAGLTVLELLELQARARAIRAQLQQEAAVSTGLPSESVTGNSSDDDEVEIKEEAAEVVEISSEDEKPNVQQLQEKIAASKDTAQDSLNSKTVTKKVNDLIITVPKANTSRKIKLKRNTSSNSKAVEKVNENESNSKTPTTIVIEEETDTTNVRKQGSEINIQGGSSKSDVKNTQNSQSKTEKPTLDVSNSKDKNRTKDKKKKRKKDKQNDKDGSDDDEITLQLSDTEKMDLLEDLDGKKPEKSSVTEDSSSDSSDEDSEEDDDKHQKPNNSDANKSNLGKEKVDKETSKEVESSNETASSKNTTSDDTKTMELEEQLGDKKRSNSEVFIDKVDKQITENDKNAEVFIDKVDKQITENDKATSNDKMDETGLCDIDKSYTEILEDESANSQTTDSTEKENVVSDINVIESSSHDIMEIDSTPNVEQTIQDVEMKQDEKDSEGQATEVSQDIRNEKTTEEINIIDKVLPSTSELKVTDNTPNNQVNIANKENLNEKSDGELSDRDSSEVEASDFKPDVVCISDDDEKKGKKKKKKDKKSKKEKKSKKKKDFRESGDQNFYTEKSSSPNQLLENEVVILEVAESNDSALKSNIVVTERSRDKEVDTVSKTEEDNSKDIKVNVLGNLKPEIINTDTDLDDDVYEILELSDDSSCYEVEEISISKEPTAEEIEALSAKFDELERNRAIDDTVDERSEELDHLSWKERYLKSTKVKKVLTTANIMNAMRKKNLELKKKLQESKKDIAVENEPEKVTENVEVATNNFEDGTIDQYNTLEASTKYVDPVKEPNENTDNTGIKNGTDNAKEKDTVTKEMKKEAKQLLKMYKMLLKYNDMTKRKDPNKKKKKKKKNKEKDKSVASQVVATG